MNPYERAKAIVQEHLPEQHHGPGLRKAVLNAIQQAIVEGNNAETEARRHAENQLRGVQAAGLVVVCEAKRTFIRHYNPHTKTWFELCMAEEAPR
jgi:hypothetical protein